MQYLNYSAADLAQDTYFQRWVLERDDAVDAFWTNWLLEHPDKKPVVREATRMIELLEFDQDFERNQHFVSVWNQVSARTLDRKTPMFRQAAVWIGILLVSGFALFWLLPTSNEYTRRTQAQQESFTLPDGSTVVLNAYSAVSYQVDEFGDREVDLVGEGFFDVVKRNKADNCKTKFTVRTEMAVVEVLGTSFSVAEKAHKTQVVLATGEVKVMASEQRSIRLEPGEFVEVTSLPVALQKKKVDTQLYASWVGDQAVFEQMPLREIFSWIEDRYGKQVRLDSTAILLDSLTFTATIPNVNLEVMLEALSITHQLTIKETDQYLYIKRR